MVSFRITAMYEWYKAVVRMVHDDCTKLKRNMSRTPTSYHSDGNRREKHELIWFFDYIIVTLQQIGRNGKQKHTRKAEYQD